MTTPPAAGTAQPPMPLGYVRVLDPLHEPDLQIAALIAYGVSLTRIFVDRCSARTTRRPALAQLLAQIRPDDTLVVWRLDRIGQSTRHLLQLIVDLSAASIGFVSLTEAIDTTAADGQEQTLTLTAIDAARRRLLSERTITGLAAARAAGRTGGRPTVMTAEKLNTAEQMRAQGVDMTAIAAHLGVSRQTLYAHLRAANR